LFVKGVGKETQLKVPNNVDKSRISVGFYDNIAIIKFGKLKN